MPVRFGPGHEKAQGGFMVRKLVAAAVSAGLCTLSCLPGAAAAQEYRFTGFDAPPGVTATLNLRVPLGREPAARRVNYGLTLGYGQTVGAGLDGRARTRAVNFADFRFSDSGLTQARVASFDLANLERDRRLNLMAGKKSTLLLGAVVVAAVVICLAVCFDDNDSEPAN
jgi:hypothetical protein